MSCALVARSGAGVQLLRDLVVGAHHRDRRRLGQAHVGEQPRDVVREEVDGVVGVAGFVVSEFELYGVPRLAVEGELHLVRLHDVRGRHSGRLRGRTRDQAPGEAVPAGSQ